MEYVYRLEGLYNDEPQGLGLFQTLDKIALRVSEARELTERFESLPCPHLDEPVSFWFTEKGLRRYEKDIDYVLKRIAVHGWSLAGAFMPAPGEEGALFTKEKIIYQDENQIVFPGEEVQELASRGDIAFDEIVSVDALSRMARNEIMLAFQREIATLHFDVASSDLRAIAERVLAAYDERLPGGKGLCGMEFDILMYQLWKKNPELIGGMGYAYSWVD